MNLSHIRKLGDPILRETAMPLKYEEVNELMPVIEEMFTLVIEFREKYGRGRAIAAPQVGLSKRIICINTDRRYVLINPQISWKGKDMIEIWDDCMSFPNLFVKVMRHKKIKLTFLDTEWQMHEWTLTDDMAELIQHEYDHLDGILATDLAIDKYSLKWLGDQADLEPDL